MSDGRFDIRFVEANGLRIRYLEAGTGQPLVYLHGSGGLRLSRTHEILAESHRLIALEIPGFGEPPANEEAPSLETLAGVMNTAIATLGIAEYSLMGHSLGAKLALWMAILQPKPVYAVVLVAPTAIRRDDGAPLAAASSEEAAALLHAHPERHPLPPNSPEIAARQDRLTRRLLGPSRDNAFEARLTGVPAPVLALFGTVDRVAPAALAHFYRELLPNCHLMMVYDAAHAVDADRPEAVASLVDDFLNRRDRFLVRETSGLIHS